ncbi:Catechol 2,3-dioxygenase [Sporobacter termitidis DSM 10068]|uniref:Catechol 2,3-dioxygenase n=1 Tax=Sporobacter termitidis DSM 10068 TaxID=1123282 RepID=A0A1M5YL18_9FIRM|nr:VOC family protein [Sporobacter termitidis]SHI12692.1 Catechol 2,3-dioxygenase [Sporobacter termitidis DSM 10068]
MEPIISGIQQVGIGVADLGAARSWYGRVLGFDIPIFDDPGVADRMQRYTGGQPQSRHAILAVNLQGGGGLEIWQYTSRTPRPPAFEVRAGDLGIFLLRIKTPYVEKAYLQLKKHNADILGGIVETPEGVRALCLRDLYGNLIRLEESDALFTKTPALNGGVIGASVGVSNMEKSVRFYREILGYDKVLYDGTGAFPDMHPLPGGAGVFRRVLLGHSKPREGAFAKMLGASTIELVQCLDRTPGKIFENRCWGDPGYIQICYDIRGMSALKALCAEKGHPFTVESNPETAEKNDTFDMGEASGIFSYAEDPDGTLIEFVETHRLPIMKKLGWYLDLRKRDPKKPLPDWMLKTLRWNRKK